VGETGPAEVVTVPVGLQVVVYDELPDHGMLETAAGPAGTETAVELWWQSQTVVVKVVF